MPLMGLLQHLNPYPAFRTASQKSRELAPFEGHEGIFFTPQVYSFAKGTKLLRQRLGYITCPTLVMHDLHDRIVFSENALLIAKGVASKDVSVHFTHINERTTSHHLITTHVQTRDHVAKSVVEFANQVRQNL